MAELDRDRVLGVEHFEALEADHPVEVGDTWTAESSREHVEAQLTMPATFTTEYRFAGWETIAGVDCVRIEGRVAGGMEGTGEQHLGPALEYSGTLEGRITWLFDPIAGAVVQASGEETSEGILTAGAAETPIKQTTLIEIDRAPIR